MRGSLRIKRRSAAFVLIAAAGVALGLVFVGRDTSLERLRREGHIRIGYAVEAPYAFLTPEGEVTGESPEVAKRIVDRLGIRRIIWRNMEFGELIPELNAGRIDVIAAGLFVTEQRAKQAFFSLPTFKVRHGLLVRKETPFRFGCCYDVLTNAAVRVAVLEGSVEEEKLRGYGVSPSRIRVVPDALTGYAAVESDVVDALVLSAPAVQWMARKGRPGRTESLCDFDVFPSGGESAHGAFAFRKGDRRLVEAWNACLKAFLGSSEHRTLVARFGFTAAELPEAVAWGGGGE